MCYNVSRFNTYNNCGIKEGVVHVILDCCNVFILYVKWYKINGKWTVKSEECMLKYLKETKSIQRSLAKSPIINVKYNLENMVKNLIKRQERNNWGTIKQRRKKIVKG